MVSNALVRSIETTPFRRPLVMFTDQAFVASSKAVSVLCREVNEILIGNVVAICYHLYNGKVDCKQFFQKLSKL